MLSDEIIDKVIERVVNRIEQGNTYVLKEIGKVIKRIGTLTPSTAYQLEQILKFGGDYNKIARKLAEITELNVKDIYKIFEEVARNDYNFAKKFYDYRNAPYIPYDQNIALQNQVNAIASLTANQYLNISRTLGFAIRTNRGIKFTELSKMYQETIDTGILAVSQGKTNFDSEMYRIIKELGSSGLKTVDYASGKSIRLDSAVRMNLKDGLRTLHTEMQAQFGKEFGADGVEITVHSYPAPDHAEIQGKQFSKQAFTDLQRGLEVLDYKGFRYSLDHDHNGSYRPISTLNCYHTTFDIILGVSEPQYSDEYLQKVIDDNDKGFEFEGKHYTLYEGTQLQRKIELEVRKTKDIQITAVASYDGTDTKIGDLITQSQAKIRQLTTKYRQLSEISGLPTKMERMRVPNYKRVAINKEK